MTQQPYPEDRTPMRFYAPIAKVDAVEHIVWGYASTEAEDDQGETITRDALAAALADYLKFANIREMHQMSAVGIAEQAQIDGKGLYVGARIVDPRAWDKVTSGVYKGFSVGGRVTARDPADRSVITGLSLTEISLVDRPANPEAVFDCWKAERGEGMADRVGLNQPFQIWHCGVAAHRHLAKAEAARCLERRAGDGDGEAGDDPPAIAYADPGYQADGRKRYPLDDERHIRAAWAFIHMADNAAPYTAGELDQIRSRIVAAWQQRIDPAGPPAAADKASHRGNDQAALDDIHDRLKALTDGDCCRAAKAMGPHSPATLRHLQAAHDALCRAGARCVGAGANDATDDEFDTGKAARAGDLLKAFAADILPRLDALAQRVEDIAATPLPPVTIARGAMGIAKRDDAGYAGIAPDDIVAALARMSDEDRTLALIKAAHANPIRPFRLR
jgi:phage head maturation protease